MFEASEQVGGSMVGKPPHCPHYEFDLQCGTQPTTAQVEKLSGRLWVYWAAPSINVLNCVCMCVLCVCVYTSSKKENRM